MRADRRFRALCGVLVLALLPGTLHAQGVTGYAQVQFQSLEQAARRSDGTLGRDRIERWLQTVELQHFASPRSDLRIMSSLRFTQLAYKALPDQSQQPQGTIQITHPWASVFAAYRPTTVTGGIGPNGASQGPDSTRGRTLTARSQETVLTGQIAPPSWPRLDVAWTRRHRNADLLASEEQATSRTARMNWMNSFVNVYAGWGDQQSVRNGVVAPTRQRTANAGGSLHLTPFAASNMDLSYDVNDSRIGDPTRTSGSSRGHSASLNMGWRPNSILQGSASWLWRRGESRGPQPTLTEDQEGSVQFSIDPKGPARFVASSGARTIQTVVGRRLATSLSGVASLDGRVRPGWNGVTSLTHVTNWAPGVPRWSVDAFRAGSQMTLIRGFDAGADLQVATSDDTTLRDAATTSEANGRLRMTPWPAFTLGFNARFSRLGDRFLQRGSGLARAESWDVRWRPVPRLELTGTTAHTRARGGIRTSTQTATARLQPHPSMQWIADWSHSSDERALAGTQAVSGREVWSVHVLALLTRKLQLDAAAGIADRGSERENRQGTLTLTWAFGR